MAEPASAASRRRSSCSGRPLPLFHLDWSRPAVLEDLETGELFDLSAGSPAMLRKVLSGKFKRLQGEALLRQLLVRHARLRREGSQLQLRQFSGEEVDYEGLCRLLAGKGTSLAVRRAALALAWGVYPSGRWLADHGFEVSSLCPACGG